MFWGNMFYRSQDSGNRFVEHFGKRRVSGNPDVQYLYCLGKDGANKLKIKFCWGQKQWVLKMGLNNTGNQHGGISIKSLRS